MLHLLHISSRWQDATEKAVQLITRQQTDLIEYAKKPDANQKAVAIKKQSIEIVIELLNATDALVDTQAELLAAANNLQNKHNQLLKDFEALKEYAESKGCDLSLLQYLTPKKLPKIYG